MEQPPPPPVVRVENDGYPQNASGGRAVHDQESDLTNNFSQMSMQDGAHPPRGQLPYDPGIPRAKSANSFRPNDPIPRTNTAMAMHAAQRQRSMVVGPGPPMNGPGGGMPPPPRQGTMPLQGQWNAGPRPPPQYDTMSIRSSSTYYDAESHSSHETRDTDGSSVYSSDSQGRRMPPPGGPGYRGPPPHMQGPGGPYPPHHGYPGPGPGRHPPPPQQQYDYNPLYTAATDVLGLGPPPGAQPMPPPPPASYMNGPGGGHPGYPPPGPPQSQLAPPGQGGLFPPGQGQGSNLLRNASSASHLRPDPGSSMRPGLNRAPTTVGNLSALTSRKSKAIDVNAPPYTKEYVEQYRARIKADPDPEAHYAYAKYLIDAARKIGADSPDEKAVRKYRENLIVEALKVMRKLATQGEAYPEAQFFLANCHGTGMLGLQVDHERAYHMYLQAAKQEHPAASYRVAVCNEIGAGTKKDPNRAATFYRKAASLGDTAAMYKLGTILLHGNLGQEPNAREAIRWLRAAAEQADEDTPHALYTLAQLHEKPDNNIVPYDELYAKELYTKAGQLGHVPSQLKLGACYEYGNLGCPVDPRRSIAWYTKAAEKGDPEAELSLSGWYLTGSEGVLKQSDSEAYLWARRAANKGLPKAEYAVGYYAEVGIGVKQDMDLAKRWYMRAAAQGNKRAMARLTQIKREGLKQSHTARPTRQEANDEGCIIS
ncbi:hypothetical protein FRC03_007993 [Tulasnella sp. 419]|nr:hypothetical protein FRC03_007993 [Tulasnella sp. 419]